MYKIYEYDEIGGIHVVTETEAAEALLLWIWVRSINIVVSRRSTLPFRINE